MLWDHSLHNSRLAVCRKWWLTFRDISNHICRHANVAKCSSTWAVRNSPQVWRHYLHLRHPGSPGVRFCRVDSMFAPSQWETSLQSNAVSHCMGANLESARNIGNWMSQVWDPDRHDLDMLYRVHDWTSRSLVHDLFWGKFHLFCRDTMKGYLRMLGAKSTNKRHMGTVRAYLSMWSKSKVPLWVLESHATREVVSPMSPVTVFPRHGTSILGSVQWNLAVSKRAILRG